MESAVTMMLARVMLLPGVTSWDVFGNSRESCEVSNQAGSSYFGCRWSPQQTESLTAVGDNFQRSGIN